MVAIGRLLLSLFATASVYADPDQPIGDATLTYSLLAAYFAFAGTFMVLAFSRIRTPRAAVFGHIIDITFFASLIHLTDGVESPFFVYFTFVLFTAAIGWGWRGAALTTGATLTVYLFLTALGDADPWFHVDRIIIRVSYLLVAGVFFSYFAAVAEGSRLRLARLAEWPQTEENDKPASIAGVLSHAADILKLSGIVVVWHGGGHLRAMAFSSGDIRESKLAEGYRLAVVARPAILRGGQVQSLLDALPPTLQMTPVDGESGVVVPLQDHGPGAFVLLLGKRRFGREFLPLAAIVATRIAADLTQDELRRQTIRTAVAEERARLARDIHDDILQSLTAVALRLKAAEGKLPAGIAKQVVGVRELVTLQQRRLRELVTQVQAKSEARESFGDRMATLVSRLQIQWECTITLEVQSAPLSLPEATMRDIELFVTEAVANGARHGKAERIEITLQSTPHRLQLSIKDDGGGMQGCDGAYDHEAVIQGGLGSASLRQRAEARGWRIQLMTSVRGTDIVVQVPMRPDHQQ